MNLTGEVNVQSGQNEQGQTPQGTLEFTIQSILGDKSRDREVHVVLAKKGEEGIANTRQLVIKVSSSAYDPVVFAEGNVVVVRMDNGKKTALRGNIFRRKTGVPGISCVRKRWHMSS